MVTLPTCILPVAVLLNIVGQAVSGQPRLEERGRHTQIIPVEWTPDDVEALENKLGFYVFWTVRISTLISLQCLVCFVFVALWRGMHIARRWPALVLCAYFPLAFLVQLVRIWNFAEGRAVSSQYDIVFRFVAYGLGCAAGYLVLMAGVPQGHRRQLACTCFIFKLILPLVHLALSYVFDVYFQATSFWVRSGCVVAVCVVRCVGLHASMTIVRRFPDCPPQAASLKPWVINAFSLGAVQIMQMASPDLADAAILFACLGVVEAVRHITYLACGCTECEALLTFCAAVWRRCRARQREERRRVKQMARVVPEAAAADVGADEHRPGGAEEAEEAPPADGSRSAASLSAKRQLLAALIAATNLTDMLVIVSVAAVFLIAKINPVEGAAAPWPHEKTIATAALALGFECLTDVLVAAVGSYKTGTASEAYQVEETLEKSPALGRFLQLALATTLTLETIFAISIHLCPVPELGSRELRVIGHCAT